MSWKSEWYDLSGDLKVTVKAKDNNGKYSTFEFTCYVFDKVGEYFRLEALKEAAQGLSILRDLYCAEIIDIKKI